MLLQGKRILVTGVLTPQSLAFGIAELAQSEGAELVLTSFGRAMSLTERSARRLSPTPEVLELDVTNPAHFAAVSEALKKKWGVVHGALHAVAYAPTDALGREFPQHAVGERRDGLSHLHLLLEGAGGGGGSAHDGGR